MGFPNANKKKNNMANQTTNECGSKPRELLRMGEVAEVLGVHRNTLQRWDAAGSLPAPKVRHGKRAFWSRAEVLAWARAGANGTDGGGLRNSEGAP